MIARSPDPSDFRELVARALSEDIGAGDVTSDPLIPAGARGRASFVAKEAIVAAGLPVVGEVVGQVDPELLWSERVADGERVSIGGELAIVEGSARSILRAERTALNFLQRLSGIATMTRRYVDAVRGTRARITDTRKTIPGYRVLDKYAVVCGGGTNHRAGLFDAILIKNNHLEFHESAAEAVRIARAARRGLVVEVEVRDFEELDSALSGGPDVILLDNFTVGETRRAVDHVAGRVPLESSGGITLSNVRAYAETGVDRISIGALTHSVAAADIHLRILPCAPDAGV